MPGWEHRLIRKAHSFLPGTAVQLHLGSGFSEYLKLKDQDPPEQHEVNATALEIIDLNTLLDF